MLAMTSWLTAAQACAYVGLTTDALALTLATIRVPNLEPATATKIHAAGSSFAGLPAALAVVRCSSGSTLEVLSLVVAEPFRRLGLASNLLSWLRSEAQELHCSSLILSYPNDHANTQVMERLTPPGQGWCHSPGLRLVHLDRKGLEALLKRVNPVAKQCLRSNRFRMVAWGALSAPQRRQLMAVDKVPPWAKPDHAEIGDALGAIDPAVSQVLLDQEQPAGWLLAHSVGSSRIRVTAWWIRPGLQGRGLGLMLLKPAIATALQRHPAYSVCSFGIAADNLSMQRLSRRQLEPLSYQQQEATRAVLKWQTVT
jgi:GNAT superfamily N-acetyltransferase